MNKREKDTTEFTSRAGETDFNQSTPQGNIIIDWMMRKVFREMHLEWKQRKEGTPSLINQEGFLESGEKK